MQRVAIFQFNWGRRFALLFIFILSIVAGTLSLNPSRANAATTYKTETSDNITRKIKALKYYAGLNWCTQNDRGFHTTITGGDIDKGPRWWIDGRGSTVRLGQYIDSWGDKNGDTACNGESDSSPGWVNDLFSVFGLGSLSDKRATLVSLGYDCSKVGSDWSCTNNEINSKTSAKGILAQARNSPYLNGVNPLTEAPDYNAVNYFLAMNSLTTASMCKAQKGGSSNLVTVAQVQPDGTIVKGDWSIQNDGGLSRIVVAGIPLQDNTGSGNTCEDSAKATVNYANDYVKWVGQSACATTYPSYATDQNFLTGCAAGRANQTNYSYCVATSFSSDTSTNSNMREACFKGQGLPIDVHGVSSGSLCYINLAYTSVAQLTACVKGSLNIQDPNYCNATYPSPDAITPGKTVVDSNQASRQACKEGQKLQVIDGTVPSDATLGASSSASSGGDKTSCGVEGIGWIVCPILSFTGDLLSSAFNGLSDNFLQTDVGLFNTGSGTYLAWSVFRTFANIAFVIVFLIIIFSQLTGLGVSNYGVKKLLPRIVIAAILVNLSYFICQLAVDLSNILGYSLKQVFDGIAITAAVPTSSVASANGFGITAIILGVIATGTIAYFALAILIPILLGALLGVLMVVLMLIARKAIIILLIVLSPLAFVAFLLPNTESLFTKWRKSFMALLLLFPIISVVFGASSLASQIILKAGPGSGSQEILQIMAVGIAALPFFIVPTLLKGSLNGIGGIGGKLTGFASKMGGGLGKAGNKVFGNTALSRGREIRRQGRATYRNEKFAKAVARGGARANFAKGPTIIGAQKYANAALERSAVQTSEKADAEEVSAAETLLRTRHTNPTKLIDAAKASLSSAVDNNDSVSARAAQNILLNSGGAGIKELHSVIQDKFSDPGSKDTEVGKSIRTALNRAGLKPKNNALASWAYNDKTIGDTSREAGTFDKLSDNELGGHSIKNLEAATAAGVLDGTRAKRLIDNPVVAGAMGEEERKYVEKLMTDAGLAKSPSLAEPNTVPPTPTGGSGTDGARFSVGGSGTVEDNHRQP